MVVICPRTSMWDLLAATSSSPSSLLMPRAHVAGGLDCTPGETVMGSPDNISMNVIGVRDDGGH
jgi:hypothetical protein